MKLNASQLRKFNPGEVVDKKKGIKTQEIYIILDNVLDTYNIGAIFRLADAVAAKKVFLCGGTSTPPDHRIKKSSINTTEWIDWEYKPNAQEAIKKLKAENPEVKIAAIEQSPGSIPYNEFDYALPIAFVVGNETAGISPEVLKECDAILELPMFGVNISLNVMVSLGIVLYFALSQTTSRPDPRKG